MKNIDRWITSQFLFITKSESNYINVYEINKGIDINNKLLVILHAYAHAMVEWSHNR